MSKLKYSAQARKLLEILGDKIDINEMEKHIENNYFIVGGGHIHAYLIDKIENNIKK